MRTNGRLHSGGLIRSWACRLRRRATSAQLHGGRDDSRARETFPTPKRASVLRVLAQRSASEHPSSMALTGAASIWCLVCSARRSQPSLPHGSCAPLGRPPSSTLTAICTSPRGRHSIGSLATASPWWAPSSDTTTGGRFLAPRATLPIASSASRTRPWRATVASRLRTTRPPISSASRLRAHAVLATRRAAGRKRATLPPVGWASTPFSASSAWRRLPATVASARMRRW